MQLPSLLNHVNELARIIFKSPAPADKTASEYLRSKKYIGSKERRFISETSFSYLRQYKTVNLLLDNQDENIHPAGPSALLLLDFLQKGVESSTFQIYSLISSRRDEYPSDLAEYAITEGKIDISSVLMKFDETKSRAQNILNSKAPDLQYLSFYFSTQAWVLDELINTSPNWSIGDICKIFDASKSSAPLTLRIDENKLSRSEAANYFKSFNIETDLTKYSPSGLILRKRINFTDYEIFNSGSAEAQDEGSQLISMALNPEPGSRILDACAGAGGKSLHLASLMNDSGKITACDINNYKLKETASRAFRAGYRSIETINSENLKKRLKMKYDYVLVDAPCSGMGTIRRMPMTKYRLTPKLLERLAERQLAILEDYAKFTADNGVLVYSTCSLMPRENYAVVEKFLENNPDFTPEPLPESLKKVKARDEDFTLQLDPFHHNTDGFFMARLRRTA